MSDPNNEFLEKLIQEANRNIDMRPDILKNIYAKPITPKVGGQTQIPDAVNEACYNQQHALNGISDIAKNTEDIHDLLQTETTERKIADKENMEYTKKVDRKNLRIAIAALIVSLATILCEIFQFVFPVVRNMIQNG